MQWSVVIDKKEVKLSLPSRIPDDLAFEAEIDDQKTKMRWQKSTDTFYLIEIGPNGKEFERPFPIRSLTLAKNLDDGKTAVEIEIGKGHSISFGSNVGRYVFGQENRDKAAQAKGATIRSPMTGKVLKVFAENGKEIEAGSTVFIIEAMKMENKISAPASGTISGIKVKEGDQVKVNTVIAKIK